MKGKNVIIVDNVNNISGAPTIARDIAMALAAPIYCIREELQRSYVAKASGVRSQSVFGYFIGTLLLATNIRFIAALLRAEIVVCNTSLTFLFAVLSRCLGKQVICVLHESSAKNALYLCSIPISIAFAEVVVTPSQKAYDSLKIPIWKWVIVPNSISASYKDTAIQRVGSNSVALYILFVDDGRYCKGGTLFEEIVKLAATRELTNLIFHSTKSEKLKQYALGKTRLGPEIYSQYHFVLVLTDNNSWRETFGLVGCEAAACECVPLFTDQFAYREVWHEFDDKLFLKDREPSAILATILSLGSARESLSVLRANVRRRALEISSTENFVARWHDLIVKSS